MGPEAPELSEGVLNIVRTETEDWDELTGNLRGLSLSFHAVGRAPAKVADCRLRHDKLFVASDEARGWTQQKWFRPTYLQWEGEGVTTDFQPGSQRVAHLVSLDNWSTIPRPTIRLASGALRNLEFQATYRAFLSVEASGYRVRQIVVEFGWGVPTQPSLLVWSEVQDPTLRQFQPSDPRTEGAPHR